MKKIPPFSKLDIALLNLLDAKQMLRENKPVEALEDVNTAYELIGKFLEENRNA